MTSIAIEQTVLGLPKSDRAYLARVLLDSLDEPADADIQQLWLAEAQKRATGIDSGTVVLVSSEDLERQVQALFK